ncbi:High mobility group superfamily [Penicillium chrysogenum]|uniref:High mobility group superfamily n=1 Tax=Penicillium chrysogenum TaxID=5076 RepID=UPI0024DF071A|nr:High mobility group superfamily [Penicillium chrysogenum]KAJ5230992.1 High mobility group superfamily [Penicillium chrysogenum]
MNGSFVGKMPQGAPWDLTDPPSNLSRDMTDIPILDIDTWVRRPVKERQKETEQKGRVRRPMNSFMLYRWANIESIKGQSHQHNPREISSIAGKRWGKEPQSVRDKYSRLAKIERDGHAEAHPDYKFIRKARKRRSVTKAVAHLESSELSEYNSCDYPSVQDFEMGIQSPINYPCLGSHPGYILENLVAPMGGVLQRDRSSDLIGLPGEPHYDLLCPQSIQPLTSIFFDGSYVDPQWQSLWHF